MTASGVEHRYPYVHVDVPASSAEGVAAELWELGAEGIEERDQTTLEASASGVTLVAYFPREDEAQAVAEQMRARFDARVEYVVGDAWRDAWKAHFRPHRVGGRLVVRPPWEDVRLYPDEVPIVIDPGRAFGTGTHETTKLVLRELDRRVDAGTAVLDVGCGSGILSIAAALLGAPSVRSVDNDPIAVDATRDNAEANGVADRIEVSGDDVTTLDGRWPLVVANIEARVLVPMADALQRRVAPDGTLVLSGILVEQLDEVTAAYAGMPRRLVAADGEWIALVLAR